MFDCVFRPSKWLKRRQHSLSDTPLSQLDIFSPVSHDNASNDSRRGSVALRVDARISNDDIPCTCETPDAPRAASPSLASDRKSGGNFQRLNDTDVKTSDCAGRYMVVACGHGERGKKGTEESSCEFVASFPASQTFVGSETFGTPQESCTELCGTTGPSQTTVNDERQGQNGEGERQLQGRMFSPDPVRSRYQTTVSFSLRGSRRRPCRRLTSPLPDGEADVNTAKTRQEKDEVGGTDDLETSRFLRERTGDSSHIVCNDRRTVVVSPEQRSFKCLPSPCSPCTGLGLLGDERQKHPNERCVVHTCPVNDFSGLMVLSAPSADCRLREGVYQSQNFPLLEPTEPDAPSSEQQRQYLMTDDTATDFESSTPKLVDWQVVMEESITLDLAVESEGAEVKTQGPFGDVGKFVLANVGCETKPDIHDVPLPSLPLPPLPHSLPQQRTTYSPLSCSRDSSVCARSWPPSIEFVDDRSMGDGDDGSGEIASRDIVLRGLLTSLAANNRSGSAHGVRVAVPSPLSSSSSSRSSEEIDATSAQLEGASEFAATPFALVVEVCRAVRAFARKLLLLLVKESGGGATVSIDTCAEIVNRILEAEGVRNVRATRCLCRSIVAMSGVCETDGDVVPYVDFVAGVMELAEGRIQRDIL